MSVFDSEGTGLSFRYLRTAAVYVAAVLASGSWAQVNQYPGAALPSPASGVGGTANPGGAPTISSARRFNDSSQRGLIVEPRLELGISYSNNIDYSITDKRSDFFFEESPGIRITNGTGNVRGYFDYSLRSLQYANGSLPNSLQHDLNTAFTIQALPNHLFLDVAGQRSRTPKSVFGVQPADSSRNIYNSTHLSSYQISPYFLGRIASSFDYEIRFRRMITSSGVVLADAATNEWLGVLRQDRATQRLTIDASVAREVTSYAAGSEFTAARVMSGLNWRLGSQLYLTGYFGREKNNYLTLNQKSYENYGAGISWRLSARTNVEARKVHRFFGDGHSVAVNYGTPRVAFRYSDNKDVSLASSNLRDDPNAIAQLVDNQLQFTEPDAARRAQLVDDYLRQHGLVGRADLPALLVNSPIVTRDQQASMGLLGTQRSLTILVGRTISESLEFTARGGDLENSSHVVQNRIAMSMNQTLSSRASLALGFTLQHATGDTSAQSVRTQSLSFAFRNQLSRHASFQAGAVRSTSSSTVAPYSETLVFSRIAFRF